ncbi:MAG: DMT family transporter [Bacteroides sp.]|nr:DMT family transporter [Bacteroides sp.]MCM1085724.1 DMT family transporter [Bacteroides sp.]
MTDNKGALKGHLSILICNIVFGVNIPLSKIVMPEYISSFAMAFFRTTGALLFFWTVSLFVKWEKVPLKDLGRLAAASVFGVLLNQMLFVVGLEYAAPVETAIVVTFTPILTMLLAAFFLREPISWMKAGGVCLGLCGAVLMIAGKYITGEAVAESGRNSILGILLCLASGLFYAVYLTAFRDVVARYRPVTVMRWMFSFSALFSVPFLFRYAAAVDYAAIPPGIYLCIGYTVFMATGFTYLLIPVAQKRLRPTVLSVYNYIQPITAAALALILGQDGFTWIKGVACLLVFSGVFLVTRSKSRAQLDREALQESI